MIGLFIGSFNPPTKAHLEIVLKLKDFFDKIIYIPVNSKEKYLASFNDRVNMLKIYTRKYNFLDINTIMDKYSYFDYRILDILKKEYQNISIIMGSDLLNKLDKFTNYKYLLSNYKFIIITRENDNINEIINNKYQDYKNNFQVFEYHSDISSSKIRELIKNKKDYKDYLDKDIIDYIKNNNLYF